VIQRPASRTAPAGEVPFAATFSVCDTNPWTDCCRLSHLKPNLIKFSVLLCIYLCCRLVLGAFNDFFFTTIIYKTSNLTMKMTSLLGCCSV
jgi:hypothetical protein